MARGVAWDLLACRTSARWSWGQKAGQLCREGAQWGKALWEAVRAGRGTRPPNPTLPRPTQRNGPEQAP